MQTIIRRVGGSKTEPLRISVGPATTIALIVASVPLQGRRADPVRVCDRSAYKVLATGEHACDPSIWADDALCTSITVDQVTAHSGVDPIRAHSEELPATSFTTEAAVTVQRAARRRRSNLG